MPPPFNGSNEAFPASAALVFVVVCVEGDDMLLHMRLTREPSRTEEAAIRTLLRVGPNMLGEICQRYKPGRADLAAVGLHTIVAFQVSDVMRQVGKRGATLLTLADHPSCVDASVCRQVTLHCERLPADVAHVRPESAVSPVVRHQITPLRKRLPAVVTPEWPFPRVCSSMMCHTTLIVRGVLAPLAPVFAVPVDVAVTLLQMSVQMIPSQTGVVAVGTVMYLRLPAFTWGGQGVVRF